MIPCSRFEKFTWLKIIEKCVKAQDYLHASLNIRLVNWQEEISHNNEHLSDIENEYGLFFGKKWSNICKRSDHINNKTIAQTLAKYPSLALAERNRIILFLDKFSSKWSKILKKNGDAQPFKEVCFNAIMFLITKFTVGIRDKEN